MLHNCLTTSTSRNANIVNTTAKCRFQNSRQGKLLAALVLIALLAGSAFAADAPELTMAFFTFGQPMKDLQLVQDEVSKIALAKIGATVKLVPISVGAWNQQINLTLASGEAMDIMVTGVGPMLGFSSQVARNQLVPLDDLLAKYGQGIKAAMDPDFLAVGKVKGKMYAVPSVRDFASDLGIDFRKTMLDKYKIDIKTIKTYDDVEKVLKLIKSKEPTLTPICPGVAGTSMVGYMNNWDNLGDNFGVLLENGKTLKVVNLFETKEYADLVKKVYGWYQAGLIQKDAPTNKDSWATLVKADKLFAIATTRKPGIEGKHYVKTTDGLIGYPAGVDAMNTGYGLSMGWLFGNQLKSYIWKGDSPTLYKELEANNNSALKSKALGFTFAWRKASSMRRRPATCACTPGSWKTAGRKRLSILTPNLPWPGGPPPNARCY